MEPEWIHPFTKEQVDTWKKEFGDIFTIELSGHTYVYRGLRHAEFEVLREEERVFVEQLEKDGIPANDLQVKTLANSMKAVTTTCILFPDKYKDNLDGELAGAMEILQGVILIASGFPEVPPEPVAL